MMNYIFGPDDSNFINLQHNNTLITQRKRLHADSSFIHKTEPNYIKIPRVV